MLEFSGKRGARLMSRPIFQVMIISAVIFPAKAFSPDFVEFSCKKELATKNSHVVQHQMRLQHLSKIRPGLGKCSALQWKNVGSIYYTNSGGVSGPVQWSLVKRDTTAFDANGNVVLSKESIANSNWAIDSLVSIDSCLWQGGQTMFDHYQDFPITVGGMKWSGYLYNSQYFNNGYTFSRYEMDWDDSVKSFLGRDKDSIIYLRPYSGIWGEQYIWCPPFFAEQIHFSWDTLNSKWQIRSIEDRDSMESDSNTFVSIKKDYNLDGTTNSYKNIMKFPSVDWKIFQWSEIDEMKKDSLTGTFTDSIKKVFNSNVGDSIITTIELRLHNGIWENYYRDSCIARKDGYFHDEECYWDTLKKRWKGQDCYQDSIEKTSSGDIKEFYNEDFSWDENTWNWVGADRKENIWNSAGFKMSCTSSWWDTTKNEWYATYRAVYMPDSNGNDTFTTTYNLRSPYLPNSPMDTSISRHSYSYDDNHNVLEKIDSKWNQSVGKWIDTTRTVTFYSQIDISKSKVLSNTGSVSKLKIEITPAAIRFSGPEITGCKLYDLTGHRIRDVDQNPASSLTLYFPAGRSNFMNGVYIARLATKNCIFTHRLTIVR
jgi:hypothetical protein